jgi:hypothetical protein
MGLFFYTHDIRNLYPFRILIGLNGIAGIKRMHEHARRTGERVAFLSEKARFIQTKNGKYDELTNSGC